MRPLRSVLAALALAACASTTPTAGQESSADLDQFLAVSRVAPASPAEFTSYCDTALARAAAMKTALEAPGRPNRAVSALRPVDDLYLLIQAVADVSDLVQETNPSAEIRTAAEGCAEKVSAFATSVQLSRPIYDRLVAIDASRADASTQHILTRQIEAYRRMGVDRDEATRARITALDAEITQLSIAFNRNIRDDASEVTFRSAADLAGLPADYMAAHRPGRDGLIHIKMQNPDVVPIMTYATREETRRRVYVANRRRAYPANEQVLHDLLKKRYEFARLLNFPSYAHLITQDKMIGDPERAAAFVEQLATVARPAAQRDYARELARLQRIDRRATAVPQWSAGYIDQLIMREDYNVDPQQVRQYFSYNRTRDGIFRLVQDLFAVEIRPWANAPKWHDAVEAYEMYDNGRLIGRFYLDMHPRAGKYSHAAQFDVAMGIEGRSVPTGALICNFPSGDALMEHRDVETFLHEFGHLLHALFSGRQTWAMGNMDEIERDFIEAPSQLLEEWVWDYDTLSRFAVDANGQTIPRALVERMNAARGFGEAVGVMTQLGYSAVSLNYYNRDPADLNLDTFYREQMARYAMYQTAPDTRNFASFGHLDGYSAIYYTYQWSLAIALDLFTEFQEHGLRDQATALRYRQLVLAPAGSRAANDEIQDFIGRPSSVEAYAARLRR